jgi:hypothetical protein
MTWQCEDSVSTDSTQIHDGRSNSFLAFSHNFKLHVALLEVYIHVRPINPFPKLTMLSSVGRRVLLKIAVDSSVAARQIRLASTAMTPQGPKSPERREIHSTSRKEADAVEAAAPAVAEQKTSSIVDRFVVTAEVTVSKIFPAGFGWQTSSIIAETHLGYAPDTMAFAMTTGFGDAVGVLRGPSCLLWSQEGSHWGRHQHDQGTSHGHSARQCRFLQWNCLATTRRCPARSQLELCPGLHRNLDWLWNCLLPRSPCRTHHP